MGNGDIVIRAENISKKFCMGMKHIMLYGTADVARDFFGIKSQTDRLRDGEFWAVDDISFELKKGETLGIIGHNGSGKSTILKMLNGIYMPDKGRIELNGRVGALIEVGAGFHPMLTGRENIYVNGSILGMSKDEIDSKFDKIVEFAGIGDFIDSPVRHYSSGMYVRLGFAIAAHLQPEILLIDEILSVGDLSFQNKCMRRLSEIRQSANAAVFVSHNLEHVRALCQKVIMLQKGKVIFYGDAVDAISKYKALSCEVKFQNLMNSNLSGIYGRQSSGQIEILDSSIIDTSGNKINRLKYGEDIIFLIDFKSNVDINKPLIGVAIFDENNTMCVWQMNEDRNIKFPPIVQGNTYRFKIRFISPAISHGVYQPSFSLREMLTYETYERFNAAHFVIEGDGYNRGIIACDSSWELNRLTAS